MIRALVTLGTAAALAVAGKATYTLRDAPVEGGLCDATVKSTSGTCTHNLFICVCARLNKYF